MSETYTTAGDANPVMIGPPGDAGELPIPSDEFVLVTLEGFRAKRRAWYSREESRGMVHGRPRQLEREGVLAIELNGQPTAISWATHRNGHLKNNGRRRDGSKGGPNKFSNSLVYFGPAKDPLDAAVLLLESDEQQREALLEARDALARLAAVAGRVPGYGTAAAAGLTLGSGLIDLARQRIDDEVELLYHGAFGEAPTTEPVRAGTYTLLRPNREDPRAQDDPDLELTFKAHRFKPAGEGGKDAFTAAIESIEWTPPEDLLDDLNPENARLILEATFGSGKARQEYSFQQRLKNDEATLERVFGLRNKRVYRGPHRLGVPYSISLVVVHEDDDLELIEGLASHGATFAAAIGEEETSQAAERVAKGVQSLRAVVTELMPKKITIGQASRLIVVGAYAPNDQEPPNCVDVIERAGEWTRFQLELESERGGEAVVTLACHAS